MSGPIGGETRKSDTNRAEEDVIIAITGTKGMRAIAARDTNTSVNEKTKRRTRRLGSSPTSRPKSSADPVRP